MNSSLFFKTQLKNDLLGKATPSSLGKVVLFGQNAKHSFIHLFVLNVLIEQVIMGQIRC